jgi:triphosphatase
MPPRDHSQAYRTPLATLSAPLHNELTLTTEAAIMEVELKLLVDAKFKDALLQHPLLASHALSKPHERNVSDTYYDTPKRSLRHCDAGLRVRHIDKVWVQTLKRGGSANGGLHSRHEWESRVAGPAPDLPLLRETVDDKQTRRDVLDKPAVQHKLTPVFTTKVKRTVWDLRLEDGDLVECSLDQGRIECGDQSVPISELELELKSGEPAHLYNFALALNDTIPLHIGTQSKADRGYALLDPVTPHAVKASPLRLTATMSFEDAFQAIIANCLSHIQQNEDMVATSRDVEALHQMRVGMRRLRSALAMFDDTIRLPEVLQQELDWLAGALGAARDWDVLTISTLPSVTKELPDAPDLAPLHQAAEAMAAARHDDASSAVGSSRTTRLILGLNGWLQGSVWRAAMPPAARARARLSAPVCGFVEDTLKQDQRRLHRRGKNLATATPTARHRVRIAAKKTRYATEFFESLLKPRRARSYVAALARLQDQLGLLNDATVADRLLTELGEHNAELQASAGYIRGVLAARAQHGDAAVLKSWKRFAAMALPL